MFESHAAGIRLKPNNIGLDHSRININCKVTLHTIHTGLSIHALLTEKQKIIEKIESITIGLGGAEKVHVTFDHPI
jgi:hypothetical protein